MPKAPTAEDIDSLWISDSTEAVSEFERATLIALGNSARLPILTEKCTRWREEGIEFEAAINAAIWCEGFRAGQKWERRQVLEDIFAMEAE